MNASKQAAWLFLTLIALACSGWYFASEPPVIKLDTKTLSKTTDATVSHLTVRQYNAEGQLANSIQTPLMQHIPLNNTHVFQSPHIIIAQQDQPAWEINAQQATSLRGGEEITFIKDVVIHQAKNERTQESTLKTEEITYFPKDKFASTQKDVTFEQPGNIVHATGMKAYLAQKRVQLLGRARGTYEPNHG